MGNLADVVGIIPARFGATRLPGKPLAPILGHPMIEWVYRNAKKALKKVVVATDDLRILKAVNSFGGEAVMTPKSCKSGTDRMYFASKKFKAAYFVNIQGDEPLMNPETIVGATRLALRKKGIATAATPLDPRHQSDPNIVKVVLGRDGQALYFSRAPIPHKAHGVDRGEGPMKHLGIYVYPIEILKKFVRLPQPSLEVTEKLEQLRALYYGMKIFVAPTKHDSIGVDTRQDLKRVEKILMTPNFYSLRRELR